ncbi:hypothetical protein, partial [Nocardia sp. NPDC005998]|uniref:hypothetical protein n=1 Tax=Nocardia sp. NPDC005998 TaxID=3156894 RepID=UPI0033A8E7C8
MPRFSRDLLDTNPPADGLTLPSHSLPHMRRPEPDYRTFHAGPHRGWVPAQTSSGCVVAPVESVLRERPPLNVCQCPDRSLRGLRALPRFSRDLLDTDPPADGLTLPFHSLPHIRRPEPDYRGGHVPVHRGRVNAVKPSCGCCVVLVDGELLERLPLLGGQIPHGGARDSRARFLRGLRVLPRFSRDLLGIDSAVYQHFGWVCAGYRSVE